MEGFCQNLGCQRQMLGIVGASERTQLIRLPFISFAPSRAGSVGNHVTDIEIIFCLLVAGLPISLRSSLASWDSCRLKLRYSSSAHSVSMTCVHILYASCSGASNAVWMNARQVSVFCKMYAVTAVPRRFDQRCNVSLANYCS